MCDEIKNWTDHEKAEALLGLDIANSISQAKSFVAQLPDKEVIQMIDKELHKRAKQHALDLADKVINDPEAISKLTKQCFDAYEDYKHNG